jgi:hypothetical protein
MDLLDLLVGVDWLSILLPNDRNKCDQVKAVPWEFLWMTFALLPPFK